MGETGGDWRVVGSGLSAWYDADSHAAGAALVDRVVGVCGVVPDVDVRDRGVRVRIPVTVPNGWEVAREVSGVARELGLTAEPACLQELSFAIEAVDPAAVRAFWRLALGYSDPLEDPLRRDPRLEVRRLAEARPLRNRIHVDVVREPAAVERVRAETGCEPTGAFGVMLADDEGNEVDLVPGGELPGTSDWRTNFGAMTFYPVTAPVEVSRLVAAVAELADEAGIPLVVDVRPEGVAIDSGKDRWEDAEGAPDPRFLTLASRIEEAAREIAPSATADAEVEARVSADAGRGLGAGLGAGHRVGVRAEPGWVRFVQFGVDAMDVQRVRGFWASLLGYEYDPRPRVTDIFDPRRLNPVLFFQQLDVERRQRNRVRFELAVPEDALAGRIEVALAAGGRILSEQPCLLADPEGNEVAITVR